MSGFEQMFGLFSFLTAGRVTTSGPEMLRRSLPPGAWPCLLGRSRNPCGSFCVACQDEPYVMCP